MSVDATPPERIELEVGEMRAIRLPGLGTAGYAWDHELQPETGIVDVTWRRGETASDPRAPVGQSAPETVIVRATAPGKARLRLFQKRPWEHASPPLNSVDVQVAVTQRG